MAKGAFINDVTQPGGRGVDDSVKLCMKAYVKKAFKCDRGRRGQKIFKVA